MMLRGGEWEAGKIKTVCIEMCVRELSEGKGLFRNYCLTHTYICICLFVCLYIKECV